MPLTVFWWKKGDSDWVTKMPPGFRHRATFLWKGFWKSTSAGPTGSEASTRITSNFSLQLARYRSPSSKRTWARGFLKAVPIDGRYFCEVCDHHLVDLDHGGPDALVPHDLAERPPVAAADDEDALGIGMGEERHVREHLVVHELVLLGDHDRAVEHEHPAELVGVEDVDALVGALAAVEELLDLDGEPGAAPVLLGEPEIPEIGHRAFADALGGAGHEVSLRGAPG